MNGIDPFCTYCGQRDPLTTLNPCHVCVTIRQRLIRVDHSDEVTITDDAEFIPAWVAASTD